MAIFRVELSRAAQKHLKKIPSYIVVKLQEWVLAVGEFSLEEVRKRPGFHDELLKGNRAGQRSIRLSRGYRAIYIIKAQGAVEFVSIEEVHLHDY